MLAKHSHRETKSTERQQRKSKLDTETITLNVIIFCPKKNVSFDFVECFSPFFVFCLFFNILTAYKVMQRKQCRQEIPVNEIQHSIQEPNPGRGREEKEKGRERGEEGSGGRKWCECVHVRVHVCVCARVRVRVCVCVCVCVYVGAGESRKAREAGKHNRAHTRPSSA